MPTNATTTPTTQPSIGPGDLNQPGTTGGRPFLLSRTEWIQIQTYVTDALNLPTTDSLLRTTLGPAAPSDLSDFKPLLACYGTINTHCATWQNTTFPATVSLADDIYDYGTNKAPVYYPAIQKEADVLTNDPNNDTAKKALVAILQNLQTQAQGFSDRAAGVAKQVQQFALDTAADQTALLGSDGNGGLKKRYNDEYGTTSQDVQNLTKELQAQKIALKADNDAYNHDVIVAATTPTYAWVPPFGPVAAAIVAGIYTKRAIDDLDKAKAAADKIKNLNDQLRADANLLITIHAAENGITTIALALAAALPVIQKVQGIWSAIASDLTKIIGVIQTDIGQALPIIMNLGIDEAVTDWKNVANEANDYRVNAFVKIDTTAGGASS